MILRNNNDESKISRIYFTEADPFIQSNTENEYNRVLSLLKTWLLLSDKVIISSSHILGSEIVSKIFIENPDLLISSGVEVFKRDSCTSFKDTISIGEAEGNSAIINNRTKKQLIVADLLDNQLKNVITWNPNKAIYSYTNSIINDLEDPDSLLRRKLVGVENSDISKTIIDIQESNLINRDKVNQIAKIRLGSNYKHLVTHSNFTYYLWGAINLDCDPIFRYEEFNYGNEKIKEDINNIDKSEPGTPDIIRIVKNDAKVISVPDPYTIVADVDGREEIIKMIGVYRQGFSIQENSENETKDIDAYNFTLERLLGKTVKLTFNGMEVDEYNRSLGYIWLDNELFNETMIREGHALAKEHPNRLMHEDRLLEAMTAAKEEKLGISSDEFEGRPTIIDEPAPNPELKAHLFNRPLVLGDKTTKKYYTFGQPKFNDIEFGNAVFFKTMEDAIKDGYIPGEV